MASRSPGKRALAKRAVAKRAPTGRGAGARTTTRSDEANGAPPSNSVHPRTIVAWGRWLEKHHARSTGVWLISYKKATGLARFYYGDAVTEALRFGWVDSKPRTLDAERAMLWFAPRKAKAGWSRANQARIDRLIAEGRMAPAGLAKVDAARKDGSWTALSQVEALIVPHDLQLALDDEPNAADYFGAFPPSTRRAILEWIHNARKPETRATRVEETARLAAKNIRANQWQQPAGSGVKPKR